MTTLTDLRRWLDRAVARAEATGAPRQRQLLAHAAQRMEIAGDPGPGVVLHTLERPPVTIDTFLEDPAYLGGRAHIWPALRHDLRALNPDVLTGAAPVTEALLGGATGTGKSTVAIITTLYQLYLFTCFRDPRALYGLMPQTRIVFPLQSADVELTQRVLYDPLRELFEAMPFAQTHLDWNRRRTRALELEGGLLVTPVTGQMSALLGQAIPGCVLDEINFLDVVERSTRVAGPRGLGGRYDQAAELHRELTNRRPSRFGRGPVSIGTLIFSSSVNYADDFLQRRIREVLGLALPGVLVRRHRRYAVKPADIATRARFRFLLGDTRNAPRILGPDEPAPADARVELVPETYRPQFETDPAGAQRAVIGEPTGRISPFLADPAWVARALEIGETRGLANAAVPDQVVLERDGYPSWNRAAFGPAAAARFVHIDLSLNRDRCGVAVVRVADPHAPDGLWTSDGGERRPVLILEAAVGLQPSPQAELQLGDLRDWVMQLHNRLGLQITAVSLDGFQSAETRQTLHRMGIRTRLVSVDRTPEPYEGLRQALADGRLALCPSDLLARELLELERNAAAGRIDHPPRGSKDVADALCGAVWLASSHRTVRARSGYDPEQRRARPRPNPPRPAGCRSR